MLHLIFSDNGIERIKDVLRPTDQVVQLSKQHILLVDTVKYLNHSSKELTGTIIDTHTLAHLIHNATAIKGTY